MAYHLCFHCGEGCDCNEYDQCDGCSECTEAGFPEDNYEEGDFHEWEFGGEWHDDFDFGEDE